MTLLYAFLTQRVLFYRCAAYAIVFTVVKIELNLILNSWYQQINMNVQVHHMFLFVFWIKN